MQLDCISLRRRQKIYRYFFNVIKRKRIHPIEGNCKNSSVIYIASYSCKSDRLVNLFSCNYLQLLQSDISFESNDLKSHRLLLKKWVRLDSSIDDLLIPKGFQMLYNYSVGADLLTNF